MTRKLLLLFGLIVLLVACASNNPRSPRADERYAVLQTSASRKAEGIFPVLITELDGRPLSITQHDLRGFDRGYFSGRSFYRVTPGRHVIRAMGAVDRSLVPGLDRDLSRDEPMVLDANFVSGKRYFIGLKAQGSRAADWELVIWKTEDIEEGTLDLD